MNPPRSAFGARLGAACKARRRTGGAESAAFAWGRCTGALAFSLLALRAAAQAPEAGEPRAFGHFVGDVVERRVVLDVPDGMSFDAASLPAPRPGGAIELRSARLVGSRELVLVYQVFVAPTEVRTLELPPLRLRAAGPAGERTLRVDAWPLAVAPLAPVDASPRTGLGELRPDAAPPPVPTDAIRLRLGVEAALAALCAIWLLHVRVGLPWLDRRRRPFAAAWRALRRLPAVPQAAQRRAAFERLHAALDRSAGEALFASGLDRYLAAQPRFAPLGAELAAFYAASDAEFYGGGDGGVDAAWLQRLARRCRDAEQGGR